MAAKKKSPRVGRARYVPDLKPGKYSDGLPLDEVKYLECKLILKPNHFTSRQSLFDFAKILRRPAKESGVDFDTQGFINEPLKIREVLFLDTPDFELYNNAFILRRRIPYKDGFPTGDPEVVFKYRHPDLQKAALYGRNRGGWLAPEVFEYLLGRPQVDEELRNLSGPLR